MGASYFRRSVLVVLGGELQSITAVGANDGALLQGILIEVDDSAGNVPKGMRRYRKTEEYLSRKI